MNAFDYAASAAHTAKLWFRGGPPSLKESAAPSRILIIGYAAIGDLIFFLPTLEALRQAHPEAKITFIANPYPTTRELLPATGLVDDIWFVDWEGEDAGPAARARINERIAREGFDWAVLTLSSPAHYFQDGLAAIPVRCGHLRVLAGSPWTRFKRALVTGELARRVILNKTVWIGLNSEHAVTRNLRLLKSLGLNAPSAPPRPRLPLSQGHKDFAESALRGCDPAKKKIAVHLGAPGNQYFKIWDAERFGQVLGRLAREQRVEFIAVGTADERGSVERAKRLCPSLLSMVGECGLMQTIALIARCDAFIGNDTGLAKAAMALGVPTATIWGLSDIQEVGSIWEKEKHVDVRTGIACSPCAQLGMAKVGGLNYLNCGHHNCLTQMQADWAFEKIKTGFSQLLDK